MFRGSFEHTVDSKGRVSVPSRFREIIADRYEGRLVLAMDYSYDGSRGMTLNERH